MGKEKKTAPTSRVRALFGKKIRVTRSAFYHLPQVYHQPLPAARDLIRPILLGPIPVKAVAASSSPARPGGGPVSPRKRSIIFLSSLRILWQQTRPAFLHRRSFLFPGQSSLFGGGLFLFRRHPLPPLAAILHSANGLLLPQRFSFPPRRPVRKRAPANLQVRFRPELVVKWNTWKSAVRAAPAPPSTDGSARTNPAAPPAGKMRPAVKAAIVQA